MKNYTEALNLSFDPFTFNAESVDFYPGSNWQQILDQLIQISYYSSNIAVITGPLGSGKTTLARCLEQNLNDEFVTVSIRAGLFMDQLQLLESIGAGLNLETTHYSTVSEVRDGISNFVAIMEDKSKSVQLIIDDAHELGHDALRGLMDLIDRQAEAAVLGEGGIKVALFGETQILNLLTQLQPDKRSTFKLEPLLQDEAMDYVRSKLVSAGYSGRFPLEAETVAHIWEQSSGNPATINSLISNELGKKEFTVARKMPGLNFPEQHLLVASGVFAIVLFGLFMLVGGEDQPAAGDQLAGGSTSPVQRIQIPVESAAGPLPASLANDTETQTGQAEARTGVQPVEPATSDQGDSAPTQADLDPSPAIAVIENIEVPAPAKETPVSAASDAVSVPAIAQAEAIAAVQQVTLEAAAIGHQLLAYPADNFTLQLLGSRSENNVKNFIAENGSDGKISYFESRFQDRPWYVVVYGNYPDQAAAKAAVASLPRAFSDLEPWARNFSGIHQDIRAYQQ